MLNVDDVEKERKRSEQQGSRRYVSEPSWAVPFDPESMHGKIDLLTSGTSSTLFSPNSSNRPYLGSKGVCQESQRDSDIWLPPKKRVQINTPDSYISSIDNNGNSAKIPPGSETVYHLRNIHSTPNLEDRARLISGATSSMIQSPYEDERFQPESGRNMSRRVSSGPLTTISPPSSEDELVALDDQRGEEKTGNLSDGEIETIKRQLGPSTGISDDKEIDDDDDDDDDGSFSEMPQFPKTPISVGIEKVPFFNETLNTTAKESARAASVIYRPSNKTSESSSDGNMGKEEHPVKEKRRWRMTDILLILAGFLLVASLSCLIPWLVIMYRGTEGSVQRFFNRQSLEQKDALIKNFKLQYSEALRAQGIDSYYGFENFTEGPARLAINSSKTALVNTYWGLKPEYANDKEVIQLMNNSQLSNVFYGIDYSPKNVIHPACGVKERDVLLDLAALSQVTLRVRTYGMQCDQQTFILDAIQKLGLNMTLSVGVWIGNNDTINNQQMALLKQTLQRYPRDLFDCIYVGNEAIYRREKNSDEMATYIRSIKEFVTQTMKWRDLPVGVSEMASKIDLKLIEASDLVGVNIHPFFNGREAENATERVLDYINDHLEPMNYAAKSPAKIVVSEIGWPSGGGTYHQAKAGEPELQKMLDGWVCGVNKTDYPWFWFEAFDEPWKSIYNTKSRSWETQWGLFNERRVLKGNLTIPRCD